MSNLSEPAIIICRWKNLRCRRVCEFDSRTFDGIFETIFYEKKVVLQYFYFPRGELCRNSVIMTSQSLLFFESKKKNQSTSLFYNTKEFESDINEIVEEEI